eukprot:1144021-Pelagomonas_calceolata.AAC.5
MAAMLAGASLHIHSMGQAVPWTMQPCPLPQTLTLKRFRKGNNSEREYGPTTMENDPGQGSPASASLHTQPMGPGVRTARTLFENASKRVQVQEQHASWDIGTMSHCCHNVIHEMASLLAPG